MSRSARLLFVTDDFPQDGWDLAFNLQLMYHDHDLVVHRMRAPIDQRPPHPDNLEGYDHVFTLGPGKYVELDRRNIAESVRLNILADSSAMQDARLTWEGETMALTWSLD